MNSKDKEMINFKNSDYPILFKNKKELDKYIKVGIFKTILGILEIVLLISIIILIFFDKTISLVLSFALILVIIIDSINLHKQKRFTYEIVKRELTVLDYEIIYENPETGIISFIQDGIEKSISVYNSL